MKSSAQVLSGLLPPVPRHYSVDLWDVIRLMLTQSPADRPTIDEILALPVVSPFFAAAPFSCPVFVMHGAEIGRHKERRCGENGLHGCRHTFKRTATDSTRFRCGMGGSDTLADLVQCLHPL